MLFRSFTTIWLPVTGDHIVVNGSGELFVLATKNRRVTKVKIVPFRRKRHRIGDYDDDAEAEETAEEIAEEERE